jgi:short-subunit dehydrogenase
MEGDMDLRGARTLVTGATGGLGAAIARACAAGGAEIVVTGRREGPLDALAEEIGAEPVVADLANRDDFAHLVDAVRDLDVLVSNAALPGGGRMETFSTEEIDRVLDVNLRVPVLLSRHFTPTLVTRGRGHVVFVSSLAAAFPTPGLAMYNATKSALVSYGLSLRGELAPAGIGVSIVYPGPIRDAGMWADTGLVPPVGIRTRSPADVGAGVVRAIERNRAEVMVAPLALRVGAVFGRSAPAAVVRLAPRFGAYELTDAMAEALRHKR